MASDAQLTSAGFALPTAADPISNGDDAIRANASAAFDHATTTALEARSQAAVDASLKAKAAMDHADQVAAAEAAKVGASVATEVMGTVGVRVSAEAAAAADRAEANARAYTDTAFLASGPGGAADDQVDAAITRALLAGRIPTTDTPAPGVSDFVNSWWCVPRSVATPLRGCYYQGGVTRDGTMQVARLDLRRGTSETVDLGTFEKDDHNVPALLFEDDRAPLVAIVRHAVEKFVRVRVGAKPHDLASLDTATEVQVPFPGVCTYAHLIRRPTTSTVALLTRNADGWYCSVSHDWGATWTAARRFHGQAYATFRLLGHVAHYAITGHPITTPNSAIRYFKIDTVSGDITSAHSSTVIGNLWTGTAVLSSNDMTVVVQEYDPVALRTFDVGRGGSVAAMKLDKTRPELGGTYGVYRFKAAGGWTWEPLTTSGVPVGYNVSSYVGGMTFGGTDDAVWIAREDAGTWTLEHWTRTAGTWAVSRTIKTTTSSKLGRPQIPWGAEGSGLLTAVEYFRYPADTFQDYYGDQITEDTGVVEPVAPAPVLPPVGALPNTAPSTPPTLLNTGSLMLVDAMQLPAGVPTTTVPNLATGGTLAVSTTLTTQDGKMERTAVGGLHGAISQNTAAVDRRFGLASQTIRDHMAANTGHAYYVGALLAVTRQSSVATPDAGSHKMVGLWGTSSNDTLNVRVASGHKVTVAPSTNRTGYQETTSPAPISTPVLVDGAASLVPTIGTDTNVVRFGTGRTESSANGGTSWILYAAYLEDLTVSGRTYAQAHEAFTLNYPVSKAANDVHTDPVLLVP